MSLGTNQTWIDKGSEFYNRSMKSWLQGNDAEIYSVHNKGKFVVTERFIRISKNKIYKYMTSIFKNVYINKLDDIVNEYNDTYHRTIQMKPIDVNSNTYIDFNAENNVSKILNLELMIMQKYQNMKTLFQKFTLQIGLNKIL